MATKRKTLTEQVRAAIDASELSRYEICKRLPLAQATMSRFMHRQGGLSMKTLDRLAELLGLRIVVEKPKG